MFYLFTLWTCYVLHEEYKKIAAMRLRFLASENRRPDQFRVLVRNILPDPDESVSEHVEHFVYVNHPDQYLTHQEEFRLASSKTNKKESLKICMGELIVMTSRLFN